jgi:hypothetical protein
MIVSHAKRFIFLHIPKCAGTSFRESLKPYHDDPDSFWYQRHDPYFSREVDYAHLRSWELLALFPHMFDLLTEYNTMALVRSPYQRFISALTQRLTAFHPKLDFNAMDKTTVRECAENFIRDELRIERVLGNADFIHFSLQTWYINLGERRLARHVMPIPTNDDGWSKVFGVIGLPSASVGHLNRRRQPFDHLLENPAMLEYIETFYKSDLDWLRREPTLAALAERPKHDALAPQ